MPAEAALSSWWFVDEAVKKKPQLEVLRSMQFEGWQMLSEFEKSPLIKFGPATIDFNTTVWDFNGVSNLPIPPCSLRVSFPQDDLGKAMKLYLLSCLIWRRTKTHTAISYIELLQKALTSMKVSMWSIPQITVGDCKDFLATYGNLSNSFKTTSTRQLYLFFEYCETYFGDGPCSETMRYLDSASRRFAHLLSLEEGWPAVPDGYLEPLVQTCKTSLHGDERFHSKVVAACLLIISQVGLRISEMCALEANSLEVSKGPCGLPDIVYMKYKTFKGSKGDGKYRTGRTIMNQTALNAYRWLETNCAEYRERLGTSTLLVTEKQKGRWYSTGSLQWSIKCYILEHCNTIPCINTHDRFPGLQYTVASRLLAKVGQEMRTSIAASEGDVFVYPTVHQFRVTVATKLYESGVDLRYIKKQMNHLSEDMTTSYIRSDKAIEKANSETVYKAMLGDGAKLIGGQADEFTSRVESYVQTLDEHVKADIDEVAEAVAERFPLRRKLGGICVRCGSAIPCKASSQTDEIYCAYGVCPNQCQMYFLLGETLRLVREHMRLVDLNVRDSHIKAARNELRKVQNVISSVLIPELEGLEEQVELHGIEAVISKFPDLRELAELRSTLREEAESWLSRQI